MILQRSFVFPPAIMNKAGVCGGENAPQPAAVGGDRVMTLFVMEKTAVAQIPQRQFAGRGRVIKHAAASATVIV
jgi:hypothetical protein